MSDGIEIAAGQQWIYRAPEGFEASRIVIGALVRFDDQPPVACISVRNAPQKHPDGSIVAGDVVMLPMSADALVRSVVAYDGAGEPAPGFMEALDGWQSDERGLSYFTVPFDGFLDTMIARQMAEIAGVEA
jgi:hypothetical protein